MNIDKQKFLKYLKTMAELNALSQVSYAIDVIRKEIEKGTFDSEV